MQELESGPDLRYIEAAHPGYIARLVGGIVELLPPTEQSEKERKDLEIRMANFTINKLQQIGE